MRLAIAALMMALVASATAAPAPGRRHLLADATAFSSATSTGNAQVNANSQATSTGPPAAATTIATGAGAPNQPTTVVNCNLAVTNQQISKICNGIPGETKTTTSGAVAWASARACTQSPVGTTIVRDQQGNPWGFENNASCAFRNAQGQPVTAAAQAVAAAGSSGNSGVTWENAPTCSASQSNPVADSQGRLWGYENGKSCAIRGASPSPAAATANAKATAATGRRLA